MKHLVILAILAAPVFGQFSNARKIYGVPICASLATPPTDAYLLSYSASLGCWTAVAASGGGNVSSTGTPADTAIAIYNGTGGTSLKPSLVTIDVDGNMVVPGSITAGSTGASTATAIAAPATPAAGKGAYWVDSTSKTWNLKNDAGVVSHTVQTKAAVTNQLVSAIADDGTVSTRALAAADLPAMVGDTGSGGTAGAVPAPAAGDAAKVLSGAGTWVANGGGATFTSWISPWFGATGISVNSGTQVRVWGFILPVSVTFSSIYSIPQAADAGGLYSLNIANSSGALVCHQTTGAAMGTAGTAQAFACSEGSVTLSPGVYMLMMAGSATTGKLYGTVANSVVGPYYASVASGCSTSSGVISGTCTAPSAAMSSFGVGIPGFSLQ